MVEKKEKLPILNHLGRRGYAGLLQSETGLHGFGLKKEIEKSTKIPLLGQGRQLMEDNMEDNCGLEIFKTREILPKVSLKWKSFIKGQTTKTWMLLLWNKTKTLWEGGCYQDWNKEFIPGQIMVSGTSECEARHFLGLQSMTFQECTKAWLY